MRITSAAGVLAAVSLAACATMFGGGSNQAVTLSSSPSPASFTIKSSSGLQMAQGTTPGTTRLPRKNEYQIDINAPGYQTQTMVLTKGINGWFWANLLIGGIVGMAIDFASGAAWKLEPALINVTLQKSADDGEAAMFTRVRIFNESGKLLTEKLTRLQPDNGR